MKNETLKALYSRIKNPSLAKEQAERKVCQEIFVAKIGSDDELRKRVCFKGGLILDRLSQGMRGYTKDIDFDFIKYPLSDEGLSAFFARLSELPPYQNVRIQIQSAEDLRHKNYKGKRLLLAFDDESSQFDLLVDIGVYLPLCKRNRAFDYELAFGGKSKLLVNPVERTIAEKLSVFSIYGTDNTRDKDLFDAYWLITRFEHDHSVVERILFEMLVKRGHYFKTLERALQEIVFTLENKGYQSLLARSPKNWTKRSSIDVIATILDYVRELKPKRAESNPPFQHVGRANQ